MILMNALLDAKKKNNNLMVDPGSAAFTFQIPHEKKKGTIRV